MQVELSHWEWDSFFRDIHAVVIGSGIVGLNAAIALKERKPHWKVLVLERGPLPAGASTRNAGFACFGSLSELLDDRDQNGEASMWSLLEKRWQGLARLRQRLGDFPMAYEEKGGYEIFRPEEESVFQTCAEAIPHFNRELSAMIGRKEVYQVADALIPRFGFSGVRHLIRNSAEGQIDTGKMMRALLGLAADRGVETLQGATVQQIDETPDQIVLQLDNGWRIGAAQALVATNGFASRLLPQLPVKPARNQVLITAPLPVQPISGCFHYDRGYYYFRDVGNRILFGGGRNLDPLAESTDDFGLTDKIQSSLETLLEEMILPGIPVRIERRWSGILGVGPEKKPIVQRLSNRLSVAVRMGGMGVAIGSLVGEEGAGLVLKEMD